MTIKYVGKIVSEFIQVTFLHMGYHYGGKAYNRSPSYTIGIFWWGYALPVTPELGIVLQLWYLCESCPYCVQVVMQYYLFFPNKRTLSYVDIWRVTTLSLSSGSVY